MRDGSPDTWADHLLAALLLATMVVGLWWLAALAEPGPTILP